MLGVVELRKEIMEQGWSSEVTVRSSGVTDSSSVITDRSCGVTVRSQWS